MHNSIIEVSCWYMHQEICTVLQVECHDLEQVAAQSRVPISHLVVDDSTEN